MDDCDRSRPSETGDEYHFVDRRHVRTARSTTGAFLEWAEFHGHLYGTPRPDAPEGSDVLLEIEVQGAEQVLARDPDAVVVLDPAAVDGTTRRAPARARRRRRARGRSRLRARPANSQQGQRLASYVVVNDDVERATSEILSILEGLRRQRRDPSSKD